MCVGGGGGGGMHVAELRSRPATRFISVVLQGAQRRAAAAKRRLVGGWGGGQQAGRRFWGEEARAVFFRRKELRRQTRARGMARREITRAKYEFNDKALVF